MYVLWKSCGECASEKGETSKLLLLYKSNIFRFPVKHPISCAQAIFAGHPYLTVTRGDYFIRVGEVLIKISYL